MTSNALFHPDLDPTLVEFFGPQHSKDQLPVIYLDNRMSVVDGIDWLADMVLLSGSLSRKRRAFKEPYNDGKIPGDVDKAVQMVISHANQLFGYWFPMFEVAQVRTSYRPMVTGPEPLHFDTYDGERMVTAYINISKEPRHYRVSYNFPQLLERYPKEMRAYAEAKGKNIEFQMRQDGVDGRGPQGPKAPRHDVYLAPGAIWFFNAKTFSHEVVRGTGAIGISWEVPYSGADLPPQLMHEFLQKAPA